MTIADMICKVMKKAEITDVPIKPQVWGAKSCILGISRHLKLPKENTIFYIKL